MAEIEIQVFPRGSKFVASFKIFGTQPQIEADSPRAAYKMAKQVVEDALKHASSAMIRHSGGDFRREDVPEVAIKRTNLLSDPFPAQLASGNKPLTVQEAMVRATQSIRLPPQQYVPELPSDAEVEISDSGQTFWMDGPLLDKIVPTAKAKSPDRIELPLGWLPADMRERLISRARVTVREVAPILQRELLR